MTDAARLHSNGFLILAALLGMGWALLGGGGLGQASVLALAAASLVLGLPHGALDLWVAARSGRFGQGGRFTRRGFVRFHVAYLALAGLVVASFVLLPALSLACFLVLSCWHFADDWRRLPPGIRFGCGGLIVLAPTLFHPREVASIFEAITGIVVEVPVILPYPFLLVSLWLIAGAVVGAAAMDRRAGLEVAAVVLLAFVLPPLVFFAAYFALLHGPRHMLRHGGLIGGRRARLVLTAYTGAALALVVALGTLVASQEASLTDDALRALFVGLAALTVPHALLMEHDKRLGGVGKVLPVRATA
jgi:Brp/Blh family beta-carotene 15,15'-monooxygenase